MMEAAEQSPPPEFDNAELLELLTAGDAVSLDGYAGLDDFLEVLTKAIDKKWQSFMFLEGDMEIATPEPCAVDALPEAETQYLYAIANSQESDLSLTVGFSTETFLRHIDLALGGDGEGEFTKGYEELTPAEHAVFPQISQIFIDGFCSALANLCEVPSFEAQAAQLHPAIADWAKDKDLVRFAITVRIGEAASAITLIMPARFLDPLKDAVVTVVEEEAPPIDFLWVRTLEDVVEQTEIALNVSLGTVQLSIGEINRLTPDTLLNIETDLRNLPVKDMEGRTIFNANLGKEKKFYQLIVCADSSKNGDKHAANIT